MAFIRFDKDAIDVNCIIKLGFTRRAYLDISKYYEFPEEYVEALSKSTRLIIVPFEDDDIFTITTPFGNFLCGLNQKTSDGFSIISYREIDLYSQNKALKNGVIFSVNNGIDAEVSLQEEAEFYRYLSGVKYDFNAVDIGDTSPSAQLIMNTLAEYKDRDKNTKTYSQDNAENSGQVDYGELYLKEVLKKSEQYSILASELEEKKTHEMGQMSYREFCACDYDRIDRIAYSFIVDDIDKKVFKEGVQVELQGKHGERINGEIVEVDTADSDNKRIVILFNNQISIDMFQQFGWISLSFSTVNKDVQLSANKKIITGASKATYLKDVLGANCPKGFESKDLSAVMEKLNKQEYPPNDSQLKAIERGINSKDVFLVMGPPGTGKTTVILEWVKYFVGVEHKRVLVSSQNNKAVDNVLARLAEEKDIDVIRIGSEAKLQQEVIPYMFENKLVALNQKIDSSTQKYLSLLEKAISEWSEYRNSFFALNKQLSEVEYIVERTKENIVDRLVPLMKKMKNAQSEYRNAAIKSIEVNREYKACIAEINSFQEKNIILRAIYDKQNKENIKRKERLETERKEYKKKANECAQQYNALAEKSAEQKEFIREAFVKEIKRAKRNTVKESDKYIESIPSCPGIAGLFESIRISRLAIQSPISLKKILLEIDVEIKRARDLLEVENDWREAVVGKQNYALNEIILETVDLVGATCIGVSSQKRFSNIPFDVTIIDEAGQIQIHNALVPMSVSNKLIMLGDYKQIPPTADQELLELCELNGVETDLLKKSLFEQMFVDLPDSNKMMLDTQYRMPGEIADTISEWFYNGEYKSPDFKRGLKGLLPNVSEKPFVIIDTSECTDRFETRTPERGTYNVLEAKICNEILAYILSNSINVSMGEIGVISAYGDQVAKIKSFISKTVTAEKANSMVATLDSFQGQERNLILYSFTKSSKKKATLTRIGFLNELRRLNVAMSRCKKTLIMIGDMKFLSECLYQETDEEGNKIYEHSEKEFSDFISKMIRDVEDGRGELMSYKTFTERISLNG